MWLTFALFAAFCFGIRGILYHWTSQKPIDRNLMLTGVFTTGMISTLAAAVFLGQQWTFPSLIGVAMGLFSFSANASLYKGFAVGKASIVAVFTALPPVVVVIFAYLFWHETLNGTQSAAFGAIVLGVLLIRFSGEFSVRSLSGMKWGLLTMIFFGFNDLSGKQSTRLEAHLLPTLYTMFLTGAVLFFAMWLIFRRKNNRTGQGVEQDKPSKTSKSPANWSIAKTLSWGMIVGLTNTFGMIFMMLAFDIGVTGLVSAVAAVNVLIILLYARLFLKEKMTPKEFSGVLLAFAGILILQLLD